MKLTSPRNQQKCKNHKICFSHNFCKTSGVALSPTPMILNRGAVLIIRIKWPKIQRDHLGREDKLSLELMYVSTIIS